MLLSAHCATPAARRRRPRRDAGATFTTGAGDGGCDHPRHNDSSGRNYVHWIDTNWPSAARMASDPMSSIPN